MSPIDSSAISTLTTAAKFAEERYVLLHSLVSSSEARMLFEYSQALAERGQCQTDSQVPGTPVRYSPPRMELLLQELLPQIEAASGLALDPTYSYLRIYRHGDVLARHRDRPACEISVSLCLGYVADAPWPLWIEGPRGASPVEMQPGDAVLYRGIECAHWREGFAGHQAAQVFLHYVEQNGPNADWKFDKRPALGTRCVSHSFDR